MEESARTREPRGGGGFASVDARREKTTSRRKRRAGSRSRTHVVAVVLLVHLLAQARASRVEHHGDDLLLGQEAVHVEVLLSHRPRLLAHRRPFASIEGARPWEGPTERAVSGRPRRGVWRGSCWRDGAETAKKVEPRACEDVRRVQTRARALRAPAASLGGRWFSKCSGQVGANELKLSRLKENLMTVCQPGKPNRLLLVVQISRLRDLVPRSMVNTLSHPQDGAPLSDTPPSRS